MLRTPLLLLSISLSLFVSVPAHASIYTGTMLGTNENPSNSSPATGFTWASVSGDTLDVEMYWNGLIGGPPAAAHIHCCTDPDSNVGVAVGFPDFPSLLSGTYTQSFNLMDPSIYTAGFLNNFGGGTAAGARDALIAGLESGRAYSNIHNATYPGGEIRANLAPVPEPSSALLMLAGVLGLTGYARRKRVS